MKKKKYNIGTYILLFLLSCGILSAKPALKKQLTKEIHKSFEVDYDALLGIHNKYGNINITSWNSNTIDIDVLIKVKTVSESKGQKFLDGINIDFASSSSKVGIKTEYPDQENNSWWGSWWNNNSNIDFEVHYTIKAPKGISTNLINKYGNITQASIAGSSEVINKYGDVYFDDVGGDVKLNLGYGKAKIVKAKNVNIEIKNSTLNIGTCDDITMTSKYSNFSFGNCGDMNLDSKYDEFTIESAGEIKNNGKYDDFKIGEVESFIINSKYTAVKIQRLYRKCKVETKYGNIQVKSTGPNLEFVAIESKYTNYKFGVASDFHLKFIGDHSDLSIEGPYSKYHEDKDGSDLNVKAFRGNKNALLKINATLKYGGLKIIANQ